MWAKLFAEPGFLLTWKTDRIVVLQSGDIAYSTATWRGAKPNSGGPGLVVWRRQSDGNWKVLIDSAWFSEPSSLRPEAVNLENRPAVAVGNHP